MNFFTSPRLLKSVLLSCVAFCASVTSGAETATTSEIAIGRNATAYTWGCNGSVAAQTYLLHLADKLQPDPRYREAAQQSLGFLFGRNFNGRSYVTGLGANPPQHPHDRRGEPAWPGYLVGGGWPDGKSWVDEMANYRVNEIAINWNASLVYALAAFVQVSNDDRGEKAP